MKRSELNRIMKDAVVFLERQNCKLPPFGYWQKQDWLDHMQTNAEYDEIRDAMLGWDITDYGSGDFDKIGLLMFTIRNGSYSNDRYCKPYAEKFLIVRENQVTPYHFHWKKMEDIINRGGGNLLVKVFGAAPDGQRSGEPVTISADGRSYRAPAGTVVRLTQGESITLPCGQYHTFWGEPGSGTVLVGEVSKVNDDTADNRFLEPTGRFPVIEEDEPPYFYLFNEIPDGK